MTLWAALALGQNQRPLPQGAPDETIAAQVKVHVRVSEALEPDALRRLARPQVTLWLATRSNTLMESTVEHLARFDAAWVELRAPLKPVDARVFARLPRVGVAVAPEDLAVASRVPGPRQVAVRLRGPLTDERFTLLSAAHLSELDWAPGESIDLLSWARFSQLGGRRVVVASSATLLPVRCEARDARAPSVELHVASLLALSSDVFPCGAGTRVVIEPEVDAWLVRSLIARDPSVELVFEVGDDARRARAVATLLEALGVGPAR